jgi:hypothetical protein
MLAFANVIAGIFFGAALYVSLVEHPARVGCGPELAVREFGPSYHRGAAMQATLAVLGCVIALLAGWRQHDTATMVAGGLLGALVPYTLLAILPTNKRLLDPALDPRDPAAAVLLARWGRLHAVRTVVGGAAFLLLAWRLAAG